MTTIVYDHKNKQIACDSRATSGSLIVSDNLKKYIKKDGIIYFLCGKQGENLTFVTHFKELEKAHESLDNDSIFIENKCAYLAVIDDNNIFRSCDLYQ
jgi:20S proteasome alpha/beta subunit